MIRKILQWPCSPIGIGAAVSLLLGVCFIQLWPTLPPVALSSLILCTGAYAWWRYDSLYRCIGVFLFAMALACLHGAWGLSQRLDHAVETNITGTVSGLPTSDDQSTRFEFDITQSDQTFLIGKHIRLSVYGSLPKLRSGSQWYFHVQLKPPRGVLNPGGYDFERRALEQHIAAIGHVKQINLAKYLRGSSGIDVWREKTTLLIQQQVGNANARFVQALALGDTRQLSDQDWLLLRGHGLTHLIAISGFHVGLVAGFAALLMRGVYFLFPGLCRLRPRPQSMAFAAMSAALMYTAVAGFALPTWRTFLMIAVIALARISRRHSRFAHSIALASMVIVLVDPLSVLSAGFWLSFVGVAWLAWCLPDSQSISSWRIRDHVRLFFQSQWVALVGLLPLSILFFGQTSLLAPLSNMVGIPIISLLAVPLALLGLLFSLFSLSAASFFWKASAQIMAIFWQLLQSLHDPKLALLAVPEASLFSLGLALLGAFVLLQPRGVPGKALSLCLLLPLLMPALNLPKNNQVDIGLIDVGQGLSIIIKTQHHALLYDTGPGIPGRFDRGESIVIPTLQAIGIHQLDRIVVSHGDNDHSGGLGSVRRYFPNAVVFAPEGWRDQTMQACMKPQEWEWDGVTFEFLHPPPDYPYLRNESSCVLRVQAGGHSVLLAGDIGHWIEKRLLSEQAAKIDVDVLLVPHHGSETSSSPEFIDAVSPKLALIASGADNRFRHPRPSILARYEERGIETAGSVENGWLRIRLNEQGIRWLDRRRQDYPRYWHHRN
jgi:competence protein ComEC